MNLKVLQKEREYVLEIDGIITCRKGDKVTFTTKKDEVERTGYIFLITSDHILVKCEDCMTYGVKLEDIDSIYKCFLLLDICIGETYLQKQKQIGNFIITENHQEEFEFAYKETNFKVGDFVELKQKYLSPMKYRIINIESEYIEMCFKGSMHKVNFSEIESIEKLEQPKMPTDNTFEPEIPFDDETDFDKFHQEDLERQNELLKIKLEQANKVVLALVQHQNELCEEINKLKEKLNDKE